jgi:hypothetical protein
LIFILIIKIIFSVDLKHVTQFGIPYRAPLKLVTLLLANVELGFAMKYVLVSNTAVLVTHLFVTVNQFHPSLIFADNEDLSPSK